MQSASGLEHFSSSPLTYVRGSDQTGPLLEFREVD